MSDKNFVEVRLPEPDSHADSTNERGDETNAAQWELAFLHWADGIVTAYDTGIEIEGVHYDTDDDLIWKLEDDAHKLLAAIEEHRRCHDAYLKRQAEAKKEKKT